MALPEDYTNETINPALSEQAQTGALAEQAKQSALAGSYALEMTTTPTDYNGSSGYPSIREVWMDITGALARGSQYIEEKSRALESASNAINPTTIPERLREGVSGAYEATTGFAGDLGRTVASASKWAVLGIAALAVVAVVVAARRV